MITFQCRTSTRSGDSGTFQVPETGTSGTSTQVITTCSMASRTGSDTQCSFGQCPNEISDGQSGKQPGATTSWWNI